jgi:hypothetical protein
MRSKKTPCEREPFLLLHGLQHDTMFSILIASSGALLTGMMWSMVMSLPSYPQ